MLLQWLHSLLFEPLSTVSMERLTLKMLFLRFAKRIGEHQAILMEVSLFTSDGAVFFFPPPGFCAQIGFITFSAPRAVTVLALSSFMGEDESEHVLCPVRAGREYLHRTCLLWDGCPRHLVFQMNLLVIVVRIQFQLISRR